MTHRQGHLLAVAAPLVASGLQWLLWPWVQPFIWLMFYPAVFVAARAGGRIGAGMATVLSSALVWIFFASRQPDLGIDNLLATTAVFGLMGLMLGEAQEKLLRAHQRARADLLDSRSQLAAIVESSDDAIVGHDLDGRITSWNRSAELLYGHTAGEALGRSITWLYPPGQEDRAREILAQAAGGVSVKLAQAQHRHQDGRLLDVFATVSPVRDGDGQVVGTATIARDIGDQLRRDAELERHRHNLMELIDERTRELQAAMQACADTEAFAIAIADNLPVRITYWDRDLRCRFVNRGACELFGRARHELVGRPLVDVVGEEAAQEAAEHMNAAFEGHAAHFERLGTRADGSRRSNWMHIIPDVQMGGVQGILVMAEDITELKQAEQRLVELNAALAQARDHAESANRAKSAFVAHMSHEIRTPMNAIVGLTQLMLRVSVDPFQREQLAKVLDATEHLMQIADDVLDLSKVESGHMQLERIEFDAEDLLARAMSLVGERASAKRLELVLDAHALPDRLCGDPTRLSQALLNLLTNAVKFTEHGSVTLQAEVLEDAPEGLLVRFLVRDTGIGVPADRAAGLFDAFEQGDSSITRRFGGAGLGLTITRHLARLMGGDSGVQSGPEPGSTFWFTARLAAAAAPGRSRRIEDLQGLRTLLVDDLQPARQAEAAMLRTMGLHVDTADSGAQALEALSGADEPYGLIVLDWLMPGLDGIETARRIAAMAGRQRPRMLLLTAQRHDGLHSLARSAGFEAVLIKPLTTSALRDAVTGLLLQTVRVDGQEPPLAWLHLESTLRQRHAGARVLVVEDNPINQEVAVSLLRLPGLEVDVADDGAQALEKIRACADYRLVLMDMQMPVMDGLQATRAIRALPTDRPLPIIAMTANAFGEDRAACLDAGMNDHIPKPVHAQVLYATLLRWLDSTASPEEARMNTPNPADTTATAPVDPTGSTPVGGPANTDTEAICRRLEAVAGLDVRSGVMMVGGRSATYVRILGQFVRLYAHGIPDLVPALQAGDRSAARDAVHAFKGASATLGAVALAEQATALEGDILARCAITDLMLATDLLHGDLAQLLEALSTLLPAAAGPQANAGATAGAPVSATARAT